MDLVSHQNAFMIDISKLIQYCYNKGIFITEGEGLRTIEQQKIYFNSGKTKTMNSNHLRKLAHDFNFFFNGKLSYKHEDIKPIGEYWKSLNPLNRWGGDFTGFDDTNHFERNV